MYNDIKIWLVCILLIGFSNKIQGQKVPNLFLMVQNRNKVGETDQLSWQNAQDTLFTPSKRKTNVIRYEELAHILHPFRRSSAIMPDHKNKLMSIWLSIDILQKAAFDCRPVLISVKEHTSQDKTSLLKKLIYHTDTFTREYEKSSFKDPLQLADVHLIRSVALLHLDSIGNAYDSLSRVESIGTKLNDSEILFRYYCYIYYLSNTFCIMSIAAKSLDSAEIIAAKLKSTHLETHPELDAYSKGARMDHLLKNYVKVNSKTYGDSLVLLHQQLMRSSDSVYQQYAKTSSYVFLDEKFFYDSNFRKTFTYLDSAQHFGPVPHYWDSWERSVILRVLSLICVGEVSKGENVLTQINFEHTHSRVAAYALNHLAYLDRELGNFNSSNSYLRTLLTLNERRNKSNTTADSLHMYLDHRTQMLDLQASHAKEIENLSKLFFLAGIISIFTVSGTVYILKRESNRRSSKQFVRRIEQITKSQILMVEDAREQEKKKLAQDLHDDLSSSLVAILGVLKLVKSKGEKNVSPKTLENAISLVEEMYSRIRQKSRNIYLSADTRLFWSKLIEQITTLFAGSHIEVNFSGDADGIELTSEQKVAIFLLFKESASNILKHSEATQAEILFYEEQNQLILEVSDNGKGFDPVGVYYGIGLISISDRVREIGGTLSMSAIHPSGTQIRACIPVNKTTKYCHPYSASTFHNSTANRVSHSVSYGRKT